MVEVSLATIVAGGANTEAVDPRTERSRLTRGLLVTHLLAQRSVFLLVEHATRMDGLMCQADIWKYLKILFRINYLWK